MRARKMILSILFALICVDHVALLSWICLYDARSNRQDIYCQVVFVVFSFLMASISVTSISKNGSEHAHFIIHLSFLSALATALTIGVELVLPGTEIRPTVDANVFFTLAWYLQVSFVIICCGMASTTRTGPPLFFHATKKSLVERGSDDVRAPMETVSDEIGK